MSHLSLPAAQCRARYGTPSEFLKTFNPDLQLRYTSDLRRAYTSDKAPTLAVLSQAYGAQVADTWLACQLRNLSEFSGAREKITPEQIYDLANIIIAGYPSLKVTELMHFFVRFKQGYYGKFYGAVDAQVITIALRQFAAERAERIARYEREADTGRFDRWRENAVSYEDYKSSQHARQNPFIKP